MQLLFKIQIYNNNNNTWQNLFHTPYQPSPSIILESRVEMGCETDFAMYNTQYFKTSKSRLYVLHADCTFLLYFLFF